MKRNLLVVICALCFSSLNAQNLSLDSILSRIDKNNPLLLSYKNKIEGDSALVNSGGAWMPPRIGLEFDKNPYSFDNFYNGMIRTSLVQDFPNRKMILAKTDYLGSLSKIDINEGMYQRNKLFAQAKEAYNGIYISQKKVQLTKENIAILKSMIELLEKQMASGRSDIAPIFKLKARLADKETKLVHDENMIKSYMATINYLTNVDINQTFSIDTANVVKDYRNLLFIYTKDSIECKRSDIMQMNSLISSMKLNQQVTGLRSRPTFGFKFEHYTIPAKPGQFSVMGTMTIPIAPWSAKGFKSEVRSMGFKITAMENEKQNMINMTSQMIKMLVIEMNSEYQEIDNYQNKVLPAYKKSFDSYILAYGQNTSDVIMVLMAYDDLQMAQMEYIQHLETLLKVQVDYEKELQIR